MSRKIKNICMTILLVLLVVLAFFTVNYSRNDFRDRGMIPPNGELGGFRGEFQNRPEGIPVPSNMENGQMTRDPRENSREFMRPEIREPRGNNLAFNILLGVEAFGIFLILMYLIMSKFNNLTIKETFSSPSQIIIYIVAVFVLTALATILTLKLAPDRFGMMPPFYEEEEVEKDTKATDVNSGEIVAEENINLAKYNSNITINKAGN